MNKIKTSDIVDPTIQQPFTGKSLEFLQNATSAMINGLSQSMVGESYAAATAYVLKGLIAYGTNQYTEGYVLYSGELYYCPGKSTTTAFVNVPVLTITVANDATADPITFTDSVIRNVHNVRTLVLSDAVSGSGTFDLSAAIYKTNTKTISIGDWNMDNTVTLTVTHGITDFNKIRRVTVMIRNDANTSMLDLTYGNGSFPDGSITVNSADLLLRRNTGGLFDSTDYDSTGYNRGFVTIEFLN